MYFTVEYLILLLTQQICTIMNFIARPTVLQQDWCFQIFHNDISTDNKIMGIVLGIYPYERYIKLLMMIFCQIGDPVRVCLYEKNIFTIDDYACFVSDL